MTSTYVKKHHLLTKLIGKRIAQIRKEQNISQEELALKTKSMLSFNTISVLERGLGDPKISTLYEISSVFNISLSELLNIENPDINQQPDFDQQIEKLLKIIRKMDKEKLETAIRLLDVL